MVFSSHGTQGGSFKNTNGTEAVAFPFSTVHVGESQEVFEVFGVKNVQVKC